MVKKIITQVIIAAFIFAITVSPGFSAEKKDAEKGAKNQTEQSSTGGSHMGGSHHEGIDSGRAFGQHVKEMNDHFSGTHNPGVHHQGYSGIKNK